MRIPHTEVLVTSGGAEVARHVFESGEYSIGSEADCAIRIDDPALAPHHARLTLTHDQALIEDLGSGGGTFVNGRPVTKPTRLWPNQKIRVGAVITVSLRRLKDGSHPDLTLPPAQAAVNRILPEEFLRERKYDIGGVVAQGGMGAILDALESTTERTVAMKVMLDTLSPEDVVRFIGEAKVTAQLEHPNIVPIYELGVDENGQVFYTMKFVRGVTLAAVLDRLAAREPEAVKEYPLPRLLTIFQKVCDALAFAHGRRVIHRDLKPANVMIGDYGEVLVMDWGLAKVLDRAGAGAVAQAMRSSVHQAIDPMSGDLTMLGTVMGTPQYMSPEQACGEIESLDARTDIYALGAILYHILALRPALKEGNAQKMLARVRLGEIDPLTNKAAAGRGGSGHSGGPPLPHCPGGRIPESLVAVVRKAMAFDAEDRYPEVRALQRDIEAYQTGFATSAEQAGLLKQGLLLIRRHRAAFTTAFTAWLMITALAVWFVVKITRERNVAGAERDRANTTLGQLRATAPTFLEQARLLTEQEKFPEALEKIGIALTLNPTEPGFHIQRGHILQSMERFAESADAYAAALRLAPDNSIAKANLELSRSLAAKEAGGGALSSADRVQWRDALQKQGRFAEAIFASRLLAADPAKMLPAWQAKLDTWLGNGAPRLKMNGGFYWLDLSKRGITDLSPLRGMPVAFLNIENNPRVNDLTPLIDSPLIELWTGAVDGDLADISPLRGKDLRLFSISRTRVTNLDVLSGMKNLSSLSLNSTPISDLTPVRGAQLNYLSVEGSRVRILEPLRGQPLENVDVNTTQVQSLDPLADAPLETLMIEGCPRLNLASLKKRRLRTLLAAGTNLDHLEVLGEMQDLEVITLPKNLSDPGLLRRLPRLRKIDRASYQSVSGQIDQLENAADFWREYDAQEPVRESTAAFHARLKEYRAQPGWREDRIHEQPDHTFTVDLSNMKLADLSALPISSLNLAGCDIKDLRAISALPLVSLNLRETPVSDLSPLRGMKLRSLYLSNCRNISDIEPLHGMPLEKMDLAATKVTDLSALAGMPLQGLGLAELKIRDLQPLRGMPIQHLIAFHSEFPDIEPLRGLPLVVVNFSRAAVGSVAPLAGCPTLESVILPSHAQDVAALRSLPRLRMISFEWDGKTPDTPSKTAQEFWKEFDAKKDAPKK